MTHKWYFAPSYGGQTSGLNDSGVSYFKSDPIRSIAKETLQASIDAMHGDEEKVIVKFNEFDVSHNDIPDYENLRDSFKKGVKRWEHHQDTKEFFKQGLNMLERNNVPVLAIQDYRTTGLSKVGDNKTGGWYALISASGVTEKKPTDGGSYGIGKNAPFAASALRTVLYCTKNRNEEHGFQGVARIPTIENEKSGDTQGTGYFYNISNKQPITKNEDILKPYQRFEYGTDKFILGFNDRENWQERLVDEVIGSYLIAIHRGILEVHVNDLIINKSNLSEGIEMIEKHNKDSLALQYYEVLQSRFTITFEENFKTDRGTREPVTLKLLAKDGFKKRVGIHRKTGMKIYDKGYFHTPLDFSGILIVEGSRLNEILRMMEPPTHDKWDAKLFKQNQVYAEGLIQSLNKWMNKSAKRLLNNNAEKTLQIEGIENILPDFNNKKAKTKQIEKNNMGDHATAISFKKRKRTPRKTTSGKHKDDIPVKGQGGKSEKKRKGRSSPTSNKGPSKTGVTKVNVYCTNTHEQIYSIFFTTKDRGEVTFEVNPVGENGQTSLVEILEATIDGFKLPVSKNTVGPVNMESEVNAIIEMKINTSNRLALEVIQS